ncbi:MAG: MATE family efflux transporter, partial [Candidatus Faecousia sp.]|nr:MATE family efflux transporter [Candidatus Faecousia sp.]
QFALRSPAALFPIMALGLPNALSSILSGLASTFSNRLLSAYGTNAIAAMGAAGKITMLIGLVQMGICMGVQPMMAYNYGARNLARLKEIFLKTALLTSVVGILTTLGCSFARNTLIGLFLREEAAATMGEQMVVFLLLAGPVLGIYNLSTNFLQAAGNAPLATVVSVLRQGAVLIPLLYLMAYLFGFTGIAIAHTTSDITSALIGLFACLWQYNKLKKQLLSSVCN